MSVRLSRSFNKPKPSRSELEDSRRKPTAREDRGTATSRAREELRPGNASFPAQLLQPFTAVLVERQHDEINNFPELTAENYVLDEIDRTP